MTVKEWMPITVFKNNEGRFINMTASSGLADYTGWWNSLAGADFDKDGDIDYVAGNLGLNTRFKVSQEEPMRIMAKDFDKNGFIDPVCSYYVQGKSYPIYHRNMMIDQMPFIQVKYKRYEEYARATMDDIFSGEQMEGAYMSGYAPYPLKLNLRRYLAYWQMIIMLTGILTCC
jgi:hypothetical protein